MTKKKEKISEWKKFWMRTVGMTIGGLLAVFLVFGCQMLYFFISDKIDEMRNPPEEYVFHHDNVIVGGHGSIGDGNGIISNEGVWNWNLYNANSTVGGNSGGDNSNSWTPPDAK